MDIQTILELELHGRSNFPRSFSESVELSNLNPTGVESTEVNLVSSQLVLRSAGILVSPVRPVASANTVERGLWADGTTRLSCRNRNGLRSEAGHSPSGLQPMNLIGPDQAFERPNLVLALRGSVDQCLDRCISWAPGINPMGSQNVLGLFDDGRTGEIGDFPYRITS